jgi:hypothetical protein
MVVVVLHSQLYDRWEKVRDAQRNRQFMLGLVMGQDSIDLFSFHVSGTVRHTGLLPLQWSVDNIGWQVGGPCCREDATTTACCNV